LEMVVEVVLDVGWLLVTQLVLVQLVEAVGR
jgi:hypothetical protein